MDKNAKCGTCVFWTMRDDGKTGECRQDAPQVVALAGESYTRTAWPVTAVLDWCGRWARKL